MELSVEDRAVLAHVVIDPDAWVAHALVWSEEQWQHEKDELDKLNAHLTAGKQIDPNQKARIEKNLLVTAAMRFERAFRGKIDRWRPEYEAQKDAPGYQTRAEHEQVAEKSRVLA